MLAGLRRSLASLGEFDAIQKTLQNARKSREAIVAAAGARLTQMLPRLRATAETSGDQRAVAAARALAGKEPDIGVLRQVLDDRGGQSADEGVTMLRQAEMQVSAPSREAVAAAARELREAATSVEQSRDTDAGRARALAQLLNEALRYHAAHASSDCPVSFASKLVATIDPGLPVIDSVVLRNLELRLPTGSPDTRIARIASLHEDLAECYTRFLETDAGGYLLADFARRYREYAPRLAFELPRAFVAAQPQLPLRT